MIRRLLTAFLLAGGVSVAQQNAEIRLGLSKPIGALDIDHFALGQGGLSPEPMWADRVPEVRALHPRLIRLFLQEYFDVMPEPGKYDWRKLDASVDTIRAAGASPLMCIAIKPKALFPKVDDSVTDPNDYPSWERLISAMVRHYKERGSGILYWEIANEPDIGERGGCPYQFTPEGYARYYEHTALAVRRADPNAKVGGPALANGDSPILPALLQHCDSKGVPLDFISWHIYNSDPLRIRATIDRKKKLLQQFPKIHVETFLDEWNMSLREPSTDPRFQPCFIAETAWQMIDGGLSYSCYYHIRDFHVPQENFARFMSPHGTANMAQWWNRTGQYDGLFDFQNHVRPSYFTFLLLARLTGRRLPLTSSIATVHGLASVDATFGTSNILIWNFSSEPAHASVTVDGLQAGLTGHGLSLDAMAPSDDENIRLQPLPVRKLQPGEPSFSFDLAPYALVFWSFQ